MESPKVLTRWKAKVSAKITKATPDQIWPLFTDFFNFHNWFPGLPTCYGLYGTNGEPGCVRYCAGFSLSSCDPDEGGGGSGGHVKWSKEKLTVIDPERRSLTYEMVDNNIGFSSYVATMTVGPVDGVGCVIEWSFAVNPVEGWSLDDMVKIYELGLQGMARKIEAAF